MARNGKFILPRELGCVSGDRSLFISVLFHLVEARTHARTRCTCTLWAPGVRRMDRFFYASFGVIAVFKGKSMQWGLPVRGTCKG